MLKVAIVSSLTLSACGCLVMVGATGVGGDELSPPAPQLATSASAADRARGQERYSLFIAVVPCG